MPAAPLPAPPPAGPGSRAGGDPPWLVWLALGAIGIAALAAYANSFATPFVFDDLPGIVRNATIRHLWPPWDMLLTPAEGGSATVGRPLVNVSLALNHAVGGLDVRGYHAVNFLFHLLSSLTLFGVVRRTLAQPGRRDRFSAAALPLAFGTALVWCVHPLQTEAVTGVIQRTELLVGLFYLLTLYAFIRSTEAGTSRWWAALAVLACLLGMASKEVMVTAPLMVVLYDRVFVAGSFARAWQCRRSFYSALAGTWLLLALLVFYHGGTRGNAAGFGLGVTPWNYALTQTAAVVHYLSLSFWPAPLVFDYGTGTVTDPWSVLPQALLLILLASGVVLALRHRPAAGFAGAWFFIILAPSSSVVPLLTQTIAEHRMYLSLAAVVAAALAGLHLVLGRRGWAPALGLAGALALLTHGRNADYRDEITLWRDTAAKLPDNPRAHYNLATILARAGRTAESLTEYQAALRLAPHNADVHFNFGCTLAAVGRMADAVPEFEAARRDDPARAEYPLRLADALVALHRPEAAITCYQSALRLNPQAADTHRRLADVFFGLQQIDEAIAHYQAALRLAPADLGAHANLGAAFASQGLMDEALGEFNRAAQLAPDDPIVLTNLGNALLRQGRAVEAGEHLRRALAIKPDYTPARDLLVKAQALERAGGR